MIDDKKVIAIITAAGSGSRMRSKTTKQLIEIQNKAVIERTVEKFLSSKYVDEIIVVVRSEEEEKIKSLFESAKKKIILTTGDDTREKSTLKGLKKAENADLLVMHDGARPFVKTSMIDSMIEKSREEDAIIPCVAVKDTIKIVQDNYVTKTPKRDELYSVQTPQIYKASLIRQAYENLDVFENMVKDDSYLVSKLGQKIFVFEGDYGNIKITTKEDILFAEKLVEGEENENR